MKYIFPFFIVALLVSCKKKEAEHEPVEGLQEITSLQQINNEIASGVSMVFYHASWCSICQAQRPAVSDVAQDTDLSGVFFGEVEYDNYPDIIDEFNISGFPTIVIYKDGSEVERYTSSGHSVSTLKAAIQGYL